MRTPAVRLLATTIAVVLGTSACDASGAVVPEVAEVPLNAASVHAQTAGDALLKAVRQATSRYHSAVQSRRDGYEADDQCVAVPALGGMGYHWLNPGLLDPTFDPLWPEVLLYAPGPNGKLRLVAVEYVVIDIGQDQPYFGDHPFDVGGTPVPADHWSLHVWLYEDNPAGIFTPFNPNVSCG